MWSVLIIPYLVFTVVPSTSGSRSRCTPWRDTSPPPTSLRLAILSISSRNTMPFCSTLAMALCFSSSSLTSLAASSSISSLNASLTFILRRCFLPWPSPANIVRICSVMSSMPGGPMMSMLGRPAATSSSISLSSSWPSRSFLRKAWRVFESLSSVWAKPMSRGGGSSTSSMRSSAASSALVRTFFISDSRVCLMAISARSRTMVSTSRPT
ncbi:hypothetical protein D3C81_1604890 [compost metagenome]